MGRDQRISLLWNICSDWRKYYWSFSGKLKNQNGQWFNFTTVSPFSSSSLPLLSPLPPFLPPSLPSFLLPPPLSLETHIHTQQALLSSVVSTVTSGDHTGPTPLNLGYTSEQASLVQRVRACKDSHDILGVSRGSGRWVGHFSVVKTVCVYRLLSVGLVWPYFHFCSTLCTLPRVFHSQKVNCITLTYTWLINNVVGSMQDQEQTKEWSQCWVKLTHLAINEGKVHYYVWLKSPTSL